MRSAFSDYLADFFRQVFTLVAFVARPSGDQLEDGGGIGRSDSAGRVAGRQAGATHPAFDGEEPVSPRRSQPDSAGDHQRQSRRESIWHGRIRDSQIPRLREKPSPRKHALDPGACGNVAADGSGGRCRGLHAIALCARPDSRRPDVNRYLLCFRLRAFQSLRAGETSGLDLPAFPCRPSECPRRSSRSWIFPRK